MGSIEVGTLVCILKGPYKGHIREVSGTTTMHFGLYCWFLENELCVIKGAPQTPEPTVLYKVVTRSNGPGPSLLGKTEDTDEELATKFMLSYCEESCTVHHVVAGGRFEKQTHAVKVDGK